MWLTLWDNGNPSLQWGVVCAATLVAAATDLSSRRIPNWLTFPLLGSGLIFAGVQAGSFGLLDSVLACALLAFPFVFLFVFAQGGAGDAKLMGAVGAWLGLINGALALVCVTVAGIMFAIAYAIVCKRTREVSMNLTGMGQNLFLRVLTRSSLSGTLSPETSAKPMLKMPYGVAIFAGVWVSAIGVLLWRM